MPAIKIYYLVWHLVHIDGRNRTENFRVHQYSARIKFKKSRCVCTSSVAQCTNLPTVVTLYRPVRIAQLTLGMEGSCSGAV